MQQGLARGGFADGEMITSRDYPDVLVIDRPANLCQLYVWGRTGSWFRPAPDWPTTRPVDWDKAEETAASPKHDVMAHPHSDEVMSDGDDR